jgi:hypothetical protein
MSREDERIAEFRVRLEDLYQQAFEPTYRQLNKLARDQNLLLSRSTVGRLLNGPGRPRWDTVETFIKMCQKHAETNDPPRPLTAELADLNQWRTFYTYAVQGRTNDPQPIADPAALDGISFPSQAPERYHGETNGVAVNEPALTHAPARDPKHGTDIAHVADERRRWRNARLKWWQTSVDPSTPLLSSHAASTLPDAPGDGNVVEASLESSLINSSGVQPQDAHPRLRQAKTFYDYRPPRSTDTRATDHHVRAIFTDIRHLLGRSRERKPIPEWSPLQLSHY